MNEVMQEITVETQVKKIDSSKTEKTIEFSSLSRKVQDAVRAGIESAKAGKISSWGDFTKYIDDQNNE